MAGQQFVMAGTQAGEVIGEIESDLILSKSYSSLTEIAADVDANGGILTLNMWQIRDAYGAARLGGRVCENISSDLDKLGIIHNPRKALPANQSFRVRLWKEDSPVGNLIDAAMSRGRSNDRILRSAAAGRANDILDKITELVNDR